MEHKLKRFIIDLESFCVDAKDEDEAEKIASAQIDSGLVKIRIENVTEDVYESAP